MTERRHPTTKANEGKAGWRRLAALRNVRALAGFLRYVFDRFQRHSDLSMASALAYTSLLALVPLLAIGLAMLAAFPVFDDARRRLQEWIFTNFVPTVGAQVQGWVVHFVENAGRLTAVGVVGLAFTATMLLLTIEGSINTIFRVDKERPLSGRLFVYWTIMTLGPLLMGASFSLAGSLDRIGFWAEERGLGGVELWAAVLPSVLVVLAFSILYYAVPNRPVRMRDALVGGLTAGLLFTVMRWGFALYIGSGRTYETLYGAMAVIPIFLAWMYFSWVVVLFGAEIAAALPEWRIGRLDQAGPLPASRRLSLAIDVLHLLYQESRRGSRGISRRALLAGTAAAGDDLRWVLALLTKSRFVARFEDGRYILARDPGTVSVYDLVCALDLHLAAEAGEMATAPWRAALSDRLARSDQAERHWLGIPLRELFGEPGAGEATAAAAERLTSSASRRDTARQDRRDPPASAR